VAPARVLLIGSTGFAGGHFLEAARTAGYDVATAARRPGAADLTCDLLEPDSIRAAIAGSEPDAVVNLAGAASVGRSWREPGGAFEVNAAGVVNLLAAAAESAPEAHLLCVSSGEIYGAPGPDQLPLTEDAGVEPVNPYGTSKAAMELVCDQYARSHGLRIAVPRAFNHLGPGQSDAFAASSFARQIATAEAEGADRVALRTGDLSPERDFSDVRDVVRAYVLALDSGLTGPVNVCSGEATPLHALVAELERQARVEVEVQATVEESRLRPIEAPRIFGSYERLRAATGWKPNTTLERTLGDILDWWRGRL
jgi:GDP-4-dehydro-6-deoxy-D-mannose reductase